MVDLVETTNVSIAGQLQIRGQAYERIPSFGDNNCSVNSLALVCIDAIKRETLTFDEATFISFAEAIRRSLPTLKELLALYQNRKSTINGNPYTDVAPALAAFIAFIESHTPLTSDALNTYIKGQTTRQQIAALHVGLAPALREIGVNEYAKRLAATGLKKEEALQKEIATLKENGVWLGYEQIVAAAFFLGINLTIYSQSEDKNIKKISVSERIPGAPEGYVLHVPGHYDFLLPANQANGLAYDLRQASAKAAPHAVAFGNLTGEIIDKNSTLILCESELRKKIDSKEKMTGVAQAVEIMNKNVLELHKKSDQNVRMEVERVANESEQALNEVRRQLNITDAAIEKLGLSTFEQDLIKKPLQIDESDADAVLARSMQNAEILNFLNKHYDALKSGASYSSRRPQKQIEESAVSPSMRRSN